MSTSFFQWIVVAGFVALCWLLLGIAEQLRSLNHKIEYWGSLLNGSAEEIRVYVVELAAHAAWLDENISDMRKRLADQFPTAEEIERRSRMEPP